jgi:hypothetical protein
VTQRVSTLLLVVAGLALLPLAANATSIEAKRISFARGASSATVKGSIAGDSVIDYKVSARAGQKMTVKLSTNNSANYFNVLPPGSNDVALFIGSTSGNEWAGTLAADGDHAIRVYLMRSAARRHEKADYTLTVTVTDAATAAALGSAPAGDAKVKGTPYHATGQVPCSTGNAPAGSMQCDFGVIRGKPGNAEVHLTRRDGAKRVLTIVGSVVTADGGARVKAGKTGDLWSIDVNDDEHYRIPDAVVLGG